MTFLVVAAYLGAIVAANLLVAAYGPAISVLNAFLLVGLDLTTRDWLHLRWSGRSLAPRMAVLILTGSALSYVLGAGQIAVASAVAFALAATADAVTFALLGRRPWLVRSNGSNVVGAAVDSVVFPTLAFGALLPLIVLAQFAAKVAGGLLWSLALRAVPLRRPAA